MPAGLALSNLNGHNSCKAVWWYRGCWQELDCKQRLGLTWAGPWSMQNQLSDRQSSADQALLDLLPSTQQHLQHDSRLSGSCLRLVGSLDPWCRQKQVKHEGGCMPKTCSASCLLPQSMHKRTYTAVLMRSFKQAGRGCDAAAILASAAAELHLIQAHRYSC